MGFWDAGTHMNKKEWSASCRRMINRLQGLKTELSAASVMKAELNTPTTKPQRRVARTRAR